MRQIRQNLKQARLDKGLTQQQVASYLRVGERYYKALEYGERTGSFNLWDKLEDLFNISQRVLREIHPGKADSQ